MLAAMVALVVSQPTCVVDDWRWTPREPVLLRFANGRAWAVVEDPKCVAHALAADARAEFLADGGATLQLSRFGLRVSAHVGALPVFAPDGGDFGLGFVASPMTPLTIIRELDAGVVELVPRARTDVTPLQPWRPRRERCEDLRLERRRESSSGTVVLPRDVQLRDARGRATFRLAAGTWVEPKEGRVLLDDGAAIFGRLSPPVAPTIISGTFESLGTCCRVAEPPPRDCAHALPLFVTSGAAVEAIGTLDASVFFHVVESDGTWVTIRPSENFFALTRGWRLVVRSSDLERCSAAPDGGVISIN